MKTFVMGDIHGSYVKLMQCLYRSGFDYERDRLIQLGDVADGSERVYECVEELLKIKDLIAIRGNHDDWFNEFLLTGFHPQHWAGGADDTARSYLRLTGRERLLMKKSLGYKTALSPSDVPESHRLFFQRQHLYHIDEDNNCFVHGGFNRHQAFVGQRPQIYFWDRDLWSDALHHVAWTEHYRQEKEFRMVTPFREIFIGHTPTMNWRTDQPMKALNIHNLDTGAVHRGRLTIMDIASKEFWQSDVQFQE
jgi:serine/threonine protein phosphatase 1